MRKAPRNVLTPLNGGVNKGPSQSQAERERAIMKERFQRDIDDTVAEILAEQEDERGHQRSLEEDQASTGAMQRDEVAVALGFEGK